jgi:hypothetical protein
VKSLLNIRANAGTELDPHSSEAQRDKATEALWKDSQILAQHAGPRTADGDVYFHPDEFWQKVNSRLIDGNGQTNGELPKVIIQGPIITAYSNDGSTELVIQDKQKPYIGPIPIVP